MPKIELTTRIDALIERVFDLSRSIDLHMESTKQTGEKAIAGKTSGLIGLSETVTWRAKHFGIWQTLTSKITDFDRPINLPDQQDQHFNQLQISLLTALIIIKRRIRFHPVIPITWQATGWLTAKLHR